MRQRQYASYKAYLAHQKEKTVNPRLREKLRKRWNKDLAKFRNEFKMLQGVPRSKAICLGARMGAEVAVLKELGFDAIGIDIVPNPPLVIQGDFHDMPFPDASFGVAYSNSIDHIYNLEKFAAEASRVLTAEAWLLAKIGPHDYGDYESLELGSVENFTKHFPDFKVVRQQDNGLAGTAWRVRLLMQR